MWEVDGGEDFDHLRHDLLGIYRLIKGQITRDQEAADVWGHDNGEGGVYRELTRVRQGMFGAVTARAAPQVLRLSLIYALLDGAEHIGKKHLSAALEVWRYCEDSARYIFGEKLGDLTADRILDALKQNPEGLTRREINDLFLRHKSASEITRALGVLRNAGFAETRTEETGGRPVERWFAMGR
jgi:hypothetical protein